MRGRPGGEYAKSKEDHWALEGTRHRYDQPPRIPGTDEHAHPGERISCRCVAIPVVDDLFGAPLGRAPAPVQPRTKPARASATSKIQSWVREAPPEPTPFDAGRTRALAAGYEGLTFEQVQAVARGEVATRKGTRAPQPIPPVRLIVVQDRTGKVLETVIDDGNHRVAAARAAGAKEILADVVVERDGTEILRRRKVVVPLA